jgi:fumarate reductase iron-sulfur subunit
MSEPTIGLCVSRFNPQADSEPSQQRYEVPYHDDWVVLDALNHVKDQMDGTLSYRWSCRMGVCGSCGMMVNGEPKLTCATFLRDYYPREIRIEPLANFAVVRDLVIELDDFVGRLKAVKPWLIRDDEIAVDQGEHRQSPAELAEFKQFSMCINCALCYAACPVFGPDSEFIGPAALALAHRYNMDSRDQGEDQRQEAVASEEGIWNCTFVGECSAVCPKDVDPAAAIQRTKVSTTSNWFKSVLMPWGGR